MNADGRPSSPTGAPPVMRKTRPRTSTMVPSVVMNGLTPSLAMIRPLTSPTAAPATMPASTPAAIPNFTITMAATQPANATVDPTDRSKPPPTITKVMPIAITAMIEDCTRMLVRLSGDRKRSVISAVTAHRMMSVSSGIWPARLKRLVMGAPPALPLLVPSPLAGDGSSVSQDPLMGEGFASQNASYEDAPHPNPLPQGERGPTESVAHTYPSSPADRRAQLHLVETIGAIERGHDAALPHRQHAVA